MTHNDKKQKRYQRLCDQLEELLKTTDDTIAKMATIAALLHHKMNGYFWTGFYRLIEGDLLAGPYQGLLACQKLKRHTGVCWTAVDQKKTIVVPDVNRFPGHIACDARSQSEIAVPCFDEQNEVFAVLDIDSAERNTFDNADAAGLESIIELL